MRWSKSIGLIMVGIIAGVVGSLFIPSKSNVVLAASSDHYQDYIISTGTVFLGPASCDGVWILDYRSGKLLGTVIDKNLGKIVAWSEVDLVKQFDVKPKQDVHFMMTTGTITNNQMALYLAEVVTGKIGVYTMERSADGSGIAIMQYDMKSFRTPAANRKFAKNP